MVYGVVWCGVVWCGMVWYGVVWCGMVWYGVGIGFKTTASSILFISYVHYTYEKYSLVL